MALPGLSLPGLNISASSTLAPTAAPESRTEQLQPREEWRFEVAFGERYSITLASGQAEIFGVELAPKQAYTFTGFKGAIFTWQGCQLEISGSAESAYVGQETDYAVEWLNVHSTLEDMRNSASSNQNGGPRVLVIGPDFVGKSSFVRSLTAWAVRAGRDPTVLNLDPREGILAPPSGLTAVAVASSVDVENGYGIGPMSGPTISPVRTPLIYHFPYQSPSEKADVFKAVTTRLSLSVMSRHDEVVSAKQSGIIIDTPGAFNDPKTNYELIAHVVSEFSINLILTIGSERLAGDISKRFGSSKSADETITVFRISKPGGAVERDADFWKQLRTQQIRRYFFGSGKEALSPHSHTMTFADVDIFRAKSSTATSDNSFNPGADDDDYDIPYAKKPANNSTFERFTPTAAMSGGLLAIKFCPG